MLRFLRSRLPSLSFFGTLSGRPMDTLRDWDAALNQALAQTKDKRQRQSLIKQYIKSVMEDLHDRPTVEFPSNFQWPNLASDPLTLERDLIGRVTILDFFTYCCINCIHILAELEEIEAEFQLPELLVIGVHSAKFENEKNTENIGNAASRYNIHHPVVNDNVGALWSKLEIMCWPTLLILDPHGKPIKFYMGEGKREKISEFLQVAMPLFKEMNLMTNTSTPKLSNEVDFSDCVDGQSKVLKFPGKIAINDDGATLYISDTSHHRIVVINTETRSVETIIGDGVQGFKDGKISEARFSSPQGLCFVAPNYLYVCDTSNHAVRLVDLSSGDVTTLAGNRRRGNDFEGGKSKDQVLASPWDICLGYSPGMWEQQTDKHYDVLYIAMAGTHQIWAHALTDVKWWKGFTYPAKSFFRVAGSGAEENRNNSYPTRAAFAQPSGVSFDAEAGVLYIADSESSSIRSMHLAENGAVKGVCGGTKNPVDLFAYGDKDGKGVEARLQHPLGVVVARKNGAPILIVTDTYNHKLRLVTDLMTNAPQCTSIDLTGDNNRFNEPCGGCLSPDGSTLFICDTNNHSLKKVDLETLHVQPFGIVETSSSVDFEVADTGNQTHNVKVSSAGGNLELKFKLDIPAGVKLNSEAPSAWTLKLPNDLWTPEHENLTGPITSNEFSIHLKHNSAIANQSDLIGLKLSIFLCHSESGICSVARRSLAVKALFQELDNHTQMAVIRLDAH